MVIKKVRRGRYVQGVNKAFPSSCKQLLKLMVMLISSSQGKDSTESIIKDDMKLWRNVMGARIEDERN